jgi:transposase
MIKMINYKGAWSGIEVRDDIHEKNTSEICHAAEKYWLPIAGIVACIRVRAAGKAHADVNGAFNIFERAFQVSPIKGSSGRVARPATVGNRLE